MKISDGEMEILILTSYDEICLFVKKNAGRSAYMALAMHIILW